MSDLQINQLSFYFYFKDAVMNWREIYYLTMCAQLTQTYMPDYQTSTVNENKSISYLNEDISISFSSLAICNASF